MAQARWTLAMCDRFRCLPSQLYREDADLMRLLAIEREYGPSEVYGEEGWDYAQ